MCCADSDKDNCVRCVLMRWPSAVALTVKIMLGMLFIVSALAKFFSIDSFEIYVYSFGIISLPLSFVAARLLIGLELLLGVALVSNRFHRGVSIVALLFLLFFVVFLSYAHLIGRTDSCHCFGELLPFNPVQSILKNAVLILLLLAVYKYTPTDWHPRWPLVLVIYLLLLSAVVVYFLLQFRYIDLLTVSLLLVCMAAGVLMSFDVYRRWYVMLPAVIVPIACVFVFSPPDNLMFNDTDEHFDIELFHSSVVVGDDEDSQLAYSQDSLITLHIGDGRQIVAFFSPTCGYCLLAGEKLSTIVTRNGLDQSRVLYVFPDVKKKQLIDSYYEKSHSERFRSSYLDKMHFVRITRASIPLVLCVDDGKVVASMGYRNLNEKIVTRFLDGEEIKTESK